MQATHLRQHRNLIIQRGRKCFSQVHKLLIIGSERMIRQVQVRREILAERISNGTDTAMLQATLRFERALTTLSVLSCFLRKITSFENLESQETCGNKQ